MPNMERIEKVTNNEFAYRVGISESYASYLRTGSRKPSGDLLFRILDVYGPEGDGKLDQAETLSAYRRGADAFGRLLCDRVFSTASAEHTEPV